MLYLNVLHFITGHIVITGNNYKLSIYCTAVIKGNSLIIALFHHMFPARAHKEIHNHKFSFVREIKRQS